MDFLRYALTISLWPALGLTPRKSVQNRINIRPIDVGVCIRTDRKRLHYDPGWRAAHLAGGIFRDLNEVMLEYADTLEHCLHRRIKQLTYLLSTKQQRGQRTAAQRRAIAEDRSASSWAHPQFCVAILLPKPLALRSQYRLRSGKGRRQEIGSAVEESFCLIFEVLFDQQR